MLTDRLVTKRQDGPGGARRRRSTRERSRRRRRTPRTWHRSRDTCDGSKAPTGPTPSRRSSTTTSLSRCRTAEPLEDDTLSDRFFREMLRSAEVPLAQAVDHVVSGCSALTLGRWRHPTTVGARLAHPLFRRPGSPRSCGLSDRQRSAGTDRSIPGRCSTDHAGASVRRRASWVGSNTAPALSPRSPRSGPARRRRWPVSATSCTSPSNGLPAGSGWNSGLPHPSTRKRHCPAASTTSRGSDRSEPNVFSSSLTCRTALATPCRTRSRSAGVVRLAQALRTLPITGRYRHPGRPENRRIALLPLLHPS